LAVMKTVQLKVGPMANFVYLLVDEESKDSLVVDSGWETEPIVAAAKKERAKVRYVVATHEHFDHTTTLQELAKELGAKVVAHTSSPIEHDVSVADGEEIRLGSSAVRVLHTPGHTAYSICLYDGAEVFTGDTLFVGTIGRFEKRNATEMYHSLYEVIMQLPDSTVMYPGHDYGEVPSRTLGKERGANVYLSAKSVSGFVSTFG